MPVWWQVIQNIYPPSGSGVVPVINKLLSEARKINPEMISSYFSVPDQPPVINTVLSSGIFTLIL